MAEPLSLRTAWPVLAALASAAMLAAAHAFETFGGYAPCMLCLRQREVYWAAYEGAPGGLTVLAGPDIAAPAELRASGRLDGALVVGRGALLYSAALGLRDEPTILDPDPADLARLAVARAAAGEDLSTEPLYLRRPDAEPHAASKRVLT